MAIIIFQNHIGNRRYKWYYNEYCQKRMSGGFVMINLLISAIMQVILFSLVPFIWWLITSRKENFFYWLGFRKIKLDRSLGKAIVQTVLIAGGYALFMALIMKFFLNGVESATSQFAGQGLAAIPSVLIYAIIQTSLSEEILFRGFLGKRLIHKFGFTAGNIIQSLCFGLLHGVPFFMVTGNIFVLVLVTLLPCVLGFYEGYLNEKTAGGSIFPSWIVHALLNIISGITASL